MPRLALSDSEYVIGKAINELFFGLNPEDPLYKALYAEVEKSIKQVVDAKSFVRIMNEFNMLLAKMEEEQDSIADANKKRKEAREQDDSDKQKAQAASANTQSEYREPLEIAAKIVAELLYHHTQYEQALLEHAQVKREAAEVQNQFAQQVGAHLANQGIVLQNGQVVRLPANAPEAGVLQNRLQGQPQNPLQLVQALPDVHAQFAAQRDAIIAQPRPAAAPRNREEEAAQAIEAAVRANQLALERVNAEKKQRELLAARIIEAMRARARFEGHHLGGDFDGCVIHQLGSSFDNFFGQMAGLFNRAMMVEARLNHHAFHINLLRQQLGYEANSHFQPEYKFGR